MQNHPNQMTLDILPDENVNSSRCPKDFCVHVGGRHGTRCHLVVRAAEVPCRPEDACGLPSSTYTCPILQTDSEGPAPTPACSRVGFGLTHGWSQPTPAPDRYPAQTQ